MKSGRTQVEIIALYEELGSYRAVGSLLGCDHKTVKRYVEAAGEAGQLAPALHRVRVTDDFAGLIAERVEQTGGRVTARRLMRIVRAAGYVGSERSLRRAVAEAKTAWRAKQALEGRVYRPWVSEPGEWMLCDWGAAGLNPDLVRLAAHYRFSPRTTERSDPQSKGKVEAVVRFTKSDLIPYEGFHSLDEANQAGAAWCAEVNGEVHYETRARPLER